MTALPPVLEVTVHGSPAIGWRWGYRVCGIEHHARGRSLGAPISSLPVRLPCGGGAVRRELAGEDSHAEAAGLVVKAAYLPFSAPC